MALRHTSMRSVFTALAAIIVARFSRSLNSPCRLTGPDGQPRNHRWIGACGERAAAAWLRAQGCKVLARNHRGRRRGEVDIVARQGKVLLFVEVKTRREGAKIRPMDAVDRDKRALIERGANDWLRRLDGVLAFCSAQPRDGGTGALYVLLKQKK